MMDMIKSDYAKNNKQKHFGYCVQNKQYVDFIKRRTDIETVVRDYEEHYHAVSAWTVIYNTASVMPCTLLVHYYENRCGRLDLYSGIFLRNGRIRDCSL